MAEELPAAAPLVVRMEPIATLPVFFKLENKRAVLAGGSSPAVWKAELLAAAGARVEVFAEAPCPAMLDLLQGSGGRITLVGRAWVPDDLVGAAIALGAIEEDEEATRFRAAARDAGVPVNVIDKPAFCDFQFGTVVSRSPLLVGISTDGAAPVLGQAIRTRIEALLPQGLKAWAEAARDWRPAVQARALDFRSRRRFWEVFTARALEGASAMPSQADLEACFAAVAQVSSQVSSDTEARVTLVGAGTGSAGDVTLAAVAALQDADIVAYGEDVPAVIVGYARRESEKVPLSRTLEVGPAAARLGSLAKSGRQLVWLGRGDPQRCLVWERRADALSINENLVARISGLGRCDACSASCPQWINPA